MNPFERFLVNLDSPPWSAISRVVLGMVIPPLSGLLSGGRDRIWVALALFVVLLLLLRVVPAVLRHVLPFSGAAKEIWKARRQIAKQRDSYQWQKLFWTGLGMLPYVIVGNGLGSGELAVAVICLVGGGAGLLIWHRGNAAQSAA